MGIPNELAIPFNESKLKILSLGFSLNNPNICLIPSSDSVLPNLLFIALNI